MGPMKRGLQRLLESLRARAQASAPPLRATRPSGPVDLLTPSAPGLEALFEDRGEIGRGGMGTVRRVFDRRLLRDLALKVIEPRSGEPEKRLQRFLEEARVTGRLEHPNIVPVHELGAQGPQWYFSMKLVQGFTLEQLIDAAGTDRLEPDTLADLLGVFIKVCEAVAFAHSRGVIHRDVKPANVMVGEFGQVYLMDWGVARLLGGDVLTAQHREELIFTTEDSPGDIVGTPSYMSPEQARGDHARVDARSDVFTLGSTLYHLLTGRPPYDGRTYYMVLIQALQRRCEAPEVVDPRVPPALSRIALKAMALDPAERYASAGDLQQALEDFLRGGWHLPTETFAPGALIVRQGDDADAAYIIASGHCEAFKTGPDGHEQRLRIMGPREVFGETAILTRSPRTASVRALDEVTLMVVREATLSEALGLNAWMGSFATALARRFREVDARVGELEQELHALRKRLGDPPG
jgi:serine/threonine-protein kinase